MSAPERIWVCYTEPRADGFVGILVTNEPSEGYQEMVPAPKSTTALDPDMPADELRLHMGELTDQEVLTARAAIRWANSAHAAQVETLREALNDALGLYQVTHIHARIRAALSAVSRDDTSEVSDG